MQARSQPQSSLILVREWEQQMSSSGCCGRLQGDLLEWRGERCFPDRRASMEKAGAIYRRVRERFGSGVEVRVVDPRNLVSLIPVLFRDFRRYRVPLREALRTLFGFTVNTVVLNGRLVARGRWPEPEELVRVVAARAGSRAPVPGLHVGAAPGTELP